MVFEYSGIVLGRLRAVWCREAMFKSWFRYSSRRSGVAICREEEMTFGYLLGRRPRELHVHLLCEHIMRKK